MLQFRNDISFREVNSSFDMITTQIIVIYFNYLKITFIT